MLKKFLSFFLSAVSLLSLPLSSDAVAAGSSIELSRDSLRENVNKEFNEFVKGSKDMMNQYDGFIAVLDKVIKEDKGLKLSDRERILDAVTYAAKCHQMQTRKNAKKTPYVSHPMMVAESVITIGKVYDADVIIGALLHDTIDDTQATFHDIREKFGSKVEGFVREVTEDNTLSAVKRKKMQIIHASEKSMGASVISMADHLYNLNNLLQDPPVDWTRDRIDQYFQWAQTVVDNLPEGSVLLKAEVHRVMQEYWKKQA